MSNAISHTFQNLQLLKEEQLRAKQALKNKYPELVAQFVKLIKIVMDANGINEFDALAKIKANASMYSVPNAQMMFASALVEIVEAERLFKFAQNK